jgi:hypothetical protein
MWTPVTVTVENLPRADKAMQSPFPFKGTCRVVSEQSISGFPGVEFCRALEIPGNDRKRITIYARFPDSNPGQVGVIRRETPIELVDENGRVVHKVTVLRQPVGASGRLVVLIRSADVALTLPELDGFPKPVIGHVEPAEVPDKWFGYDGATLVVIPKVTEKLFNTETAAALKNFVAQGGRLLAIGGRNGSSFRGSALEEILPVEILKSDSYIFENGALRPASPTGTTVSAPLLQVNRIRLRPGARTLSMGDGVPLLVSRPFESGEVLFLATDWSPRVISALQVDSFFSAYVAAIPDGESASSGFLARLIQHRSVLGLGPASRLPSPMLVFGILASYAILVGPVNFLLLRKRKRLELAWVTVPGIVILYSVAIYALSSRIKGAEKVARSFQVVSGRSGARLYRADSVNMLFFPNSGRFNIGVTDPEASLTPYLPLFSSSWRGQSFHNPGPGGLASAITGVRLSVVQNPEGMRLPDKPIEQWAEDFSHISSVQDLGGPVDVALTISGDKLVGELSNASKHTLENPCLVLGRHVWELAPGEASRRELPSSAGIKSGESWPFTLSAPAVSLRREISPSTGVDVGTHQRHVTEQAIAELCRNAAGDGANPWACYLFASISAPRSRLDVSTGLTRQSAHMFLVMRVASELAGSYAPPLPQLDATAISGIGEPPRDLSRGPALFACTVPWQQRRLAQLDAAIAASAPGGTASLPRGEVFDFTRMKWLSLSRARNAQGKAHAPGAEPSVWNQSQTPERGILEFSTPSFARIAHPWTSTVFLRFSKAKESGQQPFIASASVEVARLISLVPGGGEEETP